MTLRKLLALALAAGLSIAAEKPAVRNWNTEITVTPGGSHVLGNPGADVRLTEFVSYTCPHCSHFELQSESALRVGYVASGRVSVEVRHLVRDPVDLAAALLTNCGAPAKFFMNHTAFMRGQEKWIRPLVTAGPTQRRRWTEGDFAARMRHVATDFGFYDIMRARGYDRQAADRCLADEAKARRLAEMTQEAEKLGVAGTPSFILNGLLLAGTHDWRSLEPQIRARM